jgi:hypothetical protein
VRGGRHDDIGQHVVVDVAAQRDDAGLIELHGWIGLAAVQRQLELARARKRVHLVADRVAVRKLHRGMHWHHEHVGHEGELHLVHDGVHRRCGRGAGRLGLQHQHGAHQWLAVALERVHHQGCRGYGNSGRQGAGSEQASQPSSAEFLRRA